MGHYVDIEEVVNKAMNDKNIRVEGKSDGKWEVINNPE